VEGRVMLEMIIRIKFIYEVAWLLINGVNTDLALGEPLAVWFVNGTGLYVKLP
jgi:hypothetical protein